MLDDDLNDARAEARAANREPPVTDGGKARCGSHALHCRARTGRGRMKNRPEFPGDLVSLARISATFVQPVFRRRFPPVGCPCFC